MEREPLRDAVSSATSRQKGRHAPKKADQTASGKKYIPETSSASAPKTLENPTSPRTSKNDTGEGEVRKKGRRISSAILMGKWSEAEQVSIKTWAVQAGVTGNEVRRRDRGGEDGGNLPGSKCQTQFARMGRPPRLGIPVRRAPYRCSTGQYWVKQDKFNSQLPTTDLADLYHMELCHGLARKEVTAHDSCSNICAYNTHPRHSLSHHLSVNIP